MSWTTVRSGVKTRLDTISGLAGHAKASIKRPDSVEASVVPSDPLFTAYSHASKTEVRFTVKVSVSKATLEDAQAALDGYIWPTGTDSVIAAIHGDRTLAGAVDDVQFVDVTAYEQLAESNSVRADVNFRALVSA